MQGYIQINLKEMLTQIGEDKTKIVLSDFSCPLSLDVEFFLKYKAIEFAKQGLSGTFLVFTSFKNSPVLIGYYTLASKYITIGKDVLSKTLTTRISKFGEYDDTARRYLIPALLIAQLGKNYKNQNNQLISGDELLKMACDRLSNIQIAIGGKIIYIECEDTQKLKNFYSSNGFYEFGKRELDKDEANLSGKYLIQMLKYIK